MEYLQGDRVRILGKPEWGPGIIQRNAKNGKIRVRFYEAGPKTLDVRHAKLIKVVLRDQQWFAEKARQLWERSLHH